jgi:hypothetical protein
VRIGSVYVRDGNGQVLAYVYCEDKPSSLSMAGDEALLCWTSNPKKTGCAIDCGDCAPFSAMLRNRALKADCVN